jgi:murein DD-endopeptidase MepM/ murein hydrolase activator NlpD
MKNLSLLIVLFLISKVAFSIELGNELIYTSKLKADYIPFKSAYSIHNGEVKRGNGLYQALKSVNIDNTKALNIINALRDEVEFSKLKVGDKLQSVFDNHGKLVEFSYSQNPAEKHIVEWNESESKWDYKFHEEETQWKSRILTGELRQGSTLQEDLLAQGLSAQVVNEIVQVLLCKVNFRMNARVGDKFEVLLHERLFGEQLIETKVLYTAYSGVRAGNHQAYYYEDAEKGSTYTAHYTENGQALINAGLRYPLRRLHVRSSYGWRRHPVTGRRAMHRGVDLRGYNGEPVHAVASGKVIISTYNKYAGNKVGIRHKDGSISYYYHLKRRGVKKGDWVRSHQIIGNVGATGRVTGPHLHFGFKNRRGRWMNPLNKRMIATPKLKGERFERLQKQVAEIKNLLIDMRVSEQSRYLIANLPNVKKDKSYKKTMDLFAKFTN